jgi:hypothetical protein
VQRDAEGEILASLGERDGFGGLAPARPIQVSQGVWIEVDGATPGETVLVEAYARQGSLKGAQTKKIAQDILKLALVKRDPDRAATRTVIAFASQDAYKSITGWLRQAAVTFGVELTVVEIPGELRDRIRRAQDRQMMVNADQVVDDVDVPPSAGRLDDGATDVAPSFEHTFD